MFAHVTPSYDAGGSITGFHSNRRTPTRAALQKIEPLCRDLLAEEARHADRKVGMQAGFEKLVTVLDHNKVSYDQFVFSL